MVNGQELVGNVPFNAGANPVDITYTLVMVHSALLSASEIHDIFYVFASVQRLTRS